MPASSNRTTHWFDYAALRQAVVTEKAIRGCSANTICDQTGINGFTISKFLGFEGYRVSIDGAISLAEWTNKPFSTFVKKRRSSRKQVDTYETRQLRNAAAFLNSQGVDLDKNESPVDALMRLVAELRDGAKETGE